MRAANCVRFCLNPFCRGVKMRITYPTIKMIQTNLYMICCSYQLWLEVERLEHYIHIVNAILHHKSTKLENLHFRRFFSLHLQNRNKPHNVSLSEPMVLSMKFHIRERIRIKFKTTNDRIAQSVACFWIPFELKWFPCYVLHYTTFTNLSMEYHLMCKVYTDVGGIR